MLSYSNYFSGFQKQQSSQKLEDLINRSSGLGQREKEIIFDYIKNGQSVAKSQKEYITNIIIIINSFLDYGFLRRSNTSSSGAKSSYTDDYIESVDSNSFSRADHYWEFITMLFNDFYSVRYINFYYEEASTNREKALGWILLALNQPGEITKVFLEVFGNP